MRFINSGIPAEARRLLGFDHLRSGQEEAIRALLAGHDTVFVAPHGSGKSAVCQIAGSLLDGSTVVVSPPIAHKTAHEPAHEIDRADAAGENRLAEPAGGNSMPGAEQERLILVTPEQLRDPEMLKRLQASHVTLFAVDEAHCISQWGHDFHPEYLELAGVLEALGHPTTLAMTAMASNEVRSEIVQRLALRNPCVIVRGFDRPNLHLRVDLFDTEAEKVEAVMRRVEFADKPGIVYVATHQHAESLASDLGQRGVEAVAYHGGMKAKEREAIQSRFMKEDALVIVATNAFGMGVDRPDVRFVYHADVSESLDAYYHEIGRAGRDGEPAEAVLFYRPHDISAQRYKTGAGKVEADQIETVANALVSPEGPRTSENLSKETGIPPRKLSHILHKFEESGTTRKLASGQIEVEADCSAAELTEAALRQQDSMKESRSHRLEQMQEYAEARGCRREFLLRYFGDDYSGPCGDCDRCEETAALRARGA